MLSEILSNRLVGPEDFFGLSKFSVHMNFWSNHFAKWLKLAMRFFPKSERIFYMKVSCQYGFVIDNNNESDLFK
jgi:hypothetical protein